MDRQGTHSTSANSGAFEIGVYCSALAANVELHGRGHRRPYPGSPPSERRLPAPEFGLELGDSSRISRCQVERFRQISGQIEQPPELCQLNGAGREIECKKRLLIMREGKSSNWTGSTDRPRTDGCFGGALSGSCQTESEGQLSR